MRPTLPAVLVLALMLASAAFGQGFARGGQGERTPFTDVRFEGYRAHVMLDNEWYEWLSLDGVPYDTILAEARRRDPRHWRTRIAEDLLSLLDGLGVQPGPTVNLELRALADGRKLGMSDVPMTVENRGVVRHRVFSRSVNDGWLASARDNAAIACAQLALTVRSHHAYADLNDLDLDTLEQETLRRLGDAPTYGQTILAAQRFVARLGDGHARIDGWLDHAPPGRLGFLLQHAKGGVVAFRRDPDAAKGTLLDPDNPYVASMDGVPIEQWIDAAAAYIVDGSPALVRRRSTELLRYANLVRDELSLPHTPEIDVALRNADGSSTRKLQLPITDSRGIYGEWPRTTTRVLDSGFGYIRLETMSLTAADLAELERALSSMARAPGLIIDVRGNGGGRRDAINALVPYFLDPGAPAAARVVNAARARLDIGEDPEHPDGYLANRHAFPAAWSEWSSLERAEIERFRSTFEPEWQPPKGLFSDQHYMVVSRQAGQPIYQKPVVVLMDEGCFSATDIFLGAMKGLPNVTLLGTPSSGGSAKSEDYPLSALGVRVNLASMVSYAPDGKLYDGNGITPDVMVLPIATDLIGHTDTQLDAAIEHLRAKSQE